MILTQIFGQLGFAFDGDTIYVRFLIPQAKPMKISWEEMQRRNRANVAAYYQKTRKHARKKANRFDPKAQDSGD